MINGSSFWSRDFFHGKTKDLLRAYRAKTCLGCGGCERRSSCVVYQQDGEGCFLMLIRTLTDGQPRPGAIRRKGRHHWVSASLAPSVLETDGAHGVRGVGSNWMFSFHVSWGKRCLSSHNLPALVLCRDISSLATAVVQGSLSFWKWGFLHIRMGRVTVRTGRLMHLVWLERRRCSMGFYTRLRAKRAPRYSNLQKN